MSTTATRLPPNESPTATHVPPVWKRPKSLGYHEALRGFGGIVAPLLAGFSLAAIATIVTADERPPLAEWSVAALVTAVALLLFAMQVAFASLTYNSFPADILTWRPEIMVSDRELGRARAVQASDFDEMARLGRISFLAYSGGLLAFIIGLLLMILPKDWSAGWIAGIVIASGALVGELWWIIANHTSLPHPVERDVDLSHDDPWSPDLDPIAGLAVIDLGKESAVRDYAAHEEPDTSERAAPEPQERHLSTAFQELLDELPDDWSTVDADLRITDMTRYTEAACVMVICNAQPYSDSTRHWRVRCAHRVGHAAAPAAVLTAMRMLDAAGIEGRLELCDVRAGFDERVPR